MIDSKRKKWLPRARAGGLVLFLLFSAGCRQEMALQPYYRPLEPSDFFADGRSARPLEPGIVARGHLRDDAAFFTGMNGTEREKAPDVRQAISFFAISPAAPWTALAAVGDRAPTSALVGYVSAFPLPVTAELLERGRQRYTIFCAVCHDPTGNGHGKIVERGYTAPPSYITDDSRGLARRGIKVPLRDAPVGYFFEVVSRGFGAMPDYAAQVPPRDRWAIIAYIRALQKSQYARLADLPPGERQAAQSALEARRERGDEPAR
jgi:mono/diheme cytochrome c family protein